MMCWHPPHVPRVGTAFSRPKRRAASAPCKLR